MRLVLLALAASLGLAGCGEKQAAGNTSGLDQAVSARDFATNDATAIDAATGADANMAADVDINLVDNAGGASDATAVSRGAPRTRPPTSDGNATVPASEPEAPAPEPATPEPEANSN